MLLTQFNKVPDMPNSAISNHRPEFHCRSAANCAKRRPISAVGRHGRNALKVLITIGCPVPTRQFSRMKTHFSAVDSGIPTTADRGQEDSRGRPQLERRGAWVDAAGMIVMPGAVDTHHHQYETVLRGILADGVPDPPATTHLR
jgi:hypothetical protein